VCRTTGSLVVYHATSGAAGFTEIATVDGDQPVRLEDLGPGSHASLPGRPASRPPWRPSRCHCRRVRAVLVEGRRLIVNGILTIAEPTDDAMWFLSVDGKLRPDPGGEPAELPGVDPPNRRHAVVAVVSGRPCTSSVGVRPRRRRPQDRHR
jgi:hypothetical protein